MLNLLHEVLEDAGFETTAVDCGKSALTMLAERCFDVLIVDVNLPDMNGMAIGELARERYQDQIAILVITGKNSRTGTYRRYNWARMISSASRSRSLNSSPVSRVSCAILRRANAARSRLHSRLRSGPDRHVPQCVLRHALSMAASSGANRSAHDQHTRS